MTARQKILNEHWKDTERRLQLVQQRLGANVASRFAQASLSEYGVGQTTVLDYDRRLASDVIEARRDESVAYSAYTRSLASAACR